MDYTLDSSCNVWKFWLGMNAQAGGKAAKLAEPITTSQALGRCLGSAHALLCSSSHIISIRTIIETVLLHINRLLLIARCALFERILDNVKIHLPVNLACVISFNQLLRTDAPLRQGPLPERISCFALEAAAAPRIVVISCRKMFYCGAWLLVRKSSSANICSDDDPSSAQGS